MFAYKFIVSYDGTKYNGWQKQGNTPNTVQGRLENLFTRLLNEEVEVHGAGRTDAGVHALGQVFHIHCKNDLFEKHDYNESITILNSYLPSDIRIINLEPCDLRFHSRLNAKGKLYRYTLDVSPYGNVFTRYYTYHLPEAPDIEAMKACARYCEGEHDFKSFTSNKRMKKSSVRTIYNITVNRNCQNNTVEIDFYGNGFLYNMVRIITGTLIEAGLGNIKPEEIPGIIESCDRAAAGPLAPACGLTLVEVYY